MRGSAKAASYLVNQEKLLGLLLVRAAAPMKIAVTSIPDLF